MTSTETPQLPINIIVHDDSEDVTIEWDETHPTAVLLNLDEWTEDDWHDALEKGMDQLMQTHESEALNEG